MSYRGKWELEDIFMRSKLLCYCQRSNSIPKINAKIVKIWLFAKFYQKIYQNLVLAKKRRFACLKKLLNSPKVYSLW